MIRGLCIVAGIMLLAGFGCRQLTKTIYYSMDCQRYNIDHIELRTGINVPRTLDCDCHLTNDERLVKFDLSRGLKVNDYVQQNQFIEELDGWLIKSGESENTRWTSRLDTSEYVLEFDLVYLD